MNVCFVNMSIEPYPPSNAQAISTCIQQTARELRRAGHGTTVVSRINEGSGVAGETIVPIPPTSDAGRLVRRLRHARSRLRGMDWPGQHEYLTGVRSFLKRQSTDIDVFVVANDFHAGPMLKDVAPQGRVILWLHNEQTTNHPSVEDALEAVDRIVTVSSYLRGWVLGNFPVAEQKVAVVKNGVNLEQFHPSVDFPEPSRPPRILFVGRLDEGKAPAVMLEALEELEDEGITSSATLVGGRQRFLDVGDAADAYTEGVLRRLDRLGGTFLGSVTRDLLPSVMRQHDIVCVPSKVNEAFSLVTLEAMASGCAVVASDRGGLPEACSGAAVHFDPDDVSDVRRAIGSLLRDPDLLVSFRKRAVREAQFNSWAETARGMLMAVTESE